MKSETASQLRKSKIQARNSIPAAEREALSLKISEQICASDEFQNANTVMLYKAVKGEADLKTLEMLALNSGKKLIYPLCVSNCEMIALQPMDENAWMTGFYGIPEPVQEQSVEIAPNEIDLIICPCTVFDESCNRMGMGAGFYDRFLPKCTKAHIAAVAFEVQKAPCIEREPWDRQMDMIFTENTVYRRKC